MVIKTIQSLDEIDNEKVTASDESFYEDYDEIPINPNIGDDRIIIMGPAYRLRNTKLIIALGVYHNYNEDTGEFNPDFDVSLLYKASDEPDWDRPLYYEQDPAATMIYNYLRYLQIREEEGRITVEDKDTLQYLTA